MSSESVSCLPINFHHNLYCFKSTFRLQLFHIVVNEVSCFEKRLGAVLWLASLSLREKFLIQGSVVEGENSGMLPFSECLLLYISVLSWWGGSK